MTLKSLNSDGGFGLTNGNVIIDANGNVSANNLSVSGTSDLGPIANVKISGGSNGQTIITDGTGNLSFGTVSGASNLAAPMPYYVPSANSYTVSENFQGLFFQPIEIDGALEVDGILIDVSGGGNGGGGGGNGTPGGSNTQIQYNDSGAFGGKSNFTFNEVTNIVNVPNVVVTGNITPSASNTYSLGNNTNRFNNLYLAGNTIVLGAATISANATTLILTNPNGDSFEVDPAGVDTPGNVTALGNIVSQSNITAVGNITGANISTGGRIVATGNISGGNINTSGDLAVTGNGAFGNLSTTGTLNAIANTNLLANLYVGETLRTAGQATIGNPNAATKVDLFPNGYGSFNSLTVAAAGGQSGNLSAANLSVTGTMSVNTINSIGNLNTTGTVTAQRLVANANLTAGNANLGNLVTANFFSGDGYLLSNITVAGGTSILNGNSNVAVAPNANATFTINGNANVVTVSETDTYFSTNIVANANIFASAIRQNSVSITLDGTGTWIAFNASLGNVVEIHDNYVNIAGYTNFSSYANIAGNANVGGRLIVTGNANVGNLGTGGVIVATGNITGGNLTTAGNVTAGNINGGNLVSANFFQGDGYLISNLTVGAGTAITNGNSNVQVAPNANVTITAEGNANVVTVTGNSVILDKQLLGTNANFTVANITTLNSTSLSVQNALNVNSNVTANGAITGESLLIQKVGGLKGTAVIQGNLSAQDNLFVSGYSNVQHINAASLQIAGSINANNNISADDTVSANTVSSAITLSTSGNLSVSGNANLNVLRVTGNITSGNINGGNLVSANFFSGDGYLLSNLTIPAGTSLINGTSNLFVDGSGNIRLSVAGSPNVLVTSAAGTTVVGNLSASGNANVGNLGTGRILATGNVTTSALISNGNISGTNVSASGNITAAGTANIGGNIVALNANLGNAVSANYFIGDGYLLTNLTIPAGTAIINGNSNVLVTANSDVNITVAGVANVIKVTSSNLIVTGNLVANSFANGNSNISIVGNGAINISATGVANVLKITDTAVNANVIINALQGLSVTGNANAGNIGVSGTIAAAGEIGGGSLDTGGDLRVGGNANIGNLRVLSAFTSVGNISGGNLNTTGVANVKELYVGTTGANINGYTKINANLDVTGNINVTGNLNYSNVTDLVVGDPLIYIGANNPGDTYDLGIVASYNNGTYQHTGLARNQVNDYWTFFDGVVAEPTTVIDWANAVYPTVKLGNLVATGNITATGNINASTFLGNFSGNISGNLTGIGSNTQILFNDSNVVNANVGFTFNKVSAQVNVTGNIVGGNFVTAGAISSTGNANVGNLGTGGLITATGNITGGNLVTSGVISAIGNANVGNIGATVGAFTGNITAANASLGNLVTANFISGTLTTASQPNITSIGTLSSMTATGNVIAGNVYANSGTIGANVLTANSVTGTLTTAAQPNITSVGTLTSLSVTGNITAGNLAGILANGTSNVSIPALNGNVNISAAGAANVLVITSSGANVTGTLSASGNANAGNLGVSGLITVTGNLTVGAKSNLGSVSNVIITGGSNAQVLSTDGAGNLSWVTQSGGGGSANIAISNQGLQITNAVASINFTGSGVTANATGNAVTVTVNSGGGGTASITVDTFTGNGVQTSFNLSVTPSSKDYTSVNIDGVSQLKTAYSLSGAVITFTGAPANGASIEVTTVSALSSAQPSFTTRNYTGNGVQTTYTVTNGVTSTGILVTENGILQVPETDYTVSGANLTFTTAPASNVAIQVRELGTVVPAGTSTASSARALGYSLVFGL